MRVDPLTRTRLLHAVALAVVVYGVCPLVWPRYRDAMRLTLFHRDEPAVEVRDHRGRRRMVTERELADRLRAGWRDR